MNTLNRLLSVLLLALCVVSAVAEQVNVTVMPKRMVLPPQVMLYITNPGQYFNISVQNPESQPQAVFFGAEVHRITPSSGCDIIVPAKTLPKQGIVVPANQTRVLDAVELRNMFNHVRQSDVQMPQGLFDNAASGGFGMLEEGTYEIVINAYKWDPTLSTPVLLSNPTLSRCTFTVCYQASAPRWVSPVTMNDYEDRNVATLSQQVPMLQWTSPAVSCDPTSVNYTYDLKIVQALPLQSPDEAIERNPVVYRQTSLTAPQCLVPATTIKMFSPTETYVAQITAHSSNTQVGSLGFVSLQNDGKSDLLLFRVKDYTAVPDTTTKKPEDTDDYSAWIKKAGGTDSTFTDSIYAMRNPFITAPVFMEGTARKFFVNNDIHVAWREPAYMGGDGTSPDTLRFEYDVQLFIGTSQADRAETLRGEPFYTRHIKSTDELTDSIPWSVISKEAKVGDYMVLRVQPVSLNAQSVEFCDSNANVVDFALTDYFSSYFECSNGLEVTNTKPTQQTAKELKGTSVKIGEYELVLDGAKLKDVDKKPGHFSGTGHVIWEPMKFTWKLAVKFDDIAINTDGEVYEGTVETFEGDEPEKIRGSEVVDKLFTDWGIDNLIADTGIPYADKLQEKVDGKIASLADNLGDKIADYYQDIKAGKAKIAGLLEGNFENVTFPLQIPEDINSTPVDLQISKMKFTPTSAMMDFFGTFVVPETEATKNQILVFGAPRICISPKSLIPDGVTISLIKDFTINDPATSYDCTFKAPQNLIMPEDGCYVAWSGNEFTAFRLDMDMTMPNLKKVGANGKATDENPKLHIIADVKAPVNSGGQKVAGWDWYGTATLDPFEHEDLPGYTFHAADQVYIDHSSRENVKGMPAFPKDYDLEKAEMQGKSPAEWMGVYIGEISMEFPADIKVGNGDERMKVGLYNMFIDKSGMTVEAGIVNAINYKRGEQGTIGGFAFSMDTISVNFVQNQHKDFGFRGKLEIPLFKGTVHYACNIYNQRFTQKGTKEGYAYVFKTWQMEGLNFDFVLGELSLNEDLTYFLVEALPDANGDLKTNVELLLGGEVTIAGADKVNEKLSKLPMDLTLPGIRFCNLRVANNKEFSSTYEPEMQVTAAKLIKQWTEEGTDEDGKTITWWNKAKDIELCGGQLFLNLGQWGYASPQKKIGPFNFALTKYDLDLKGEDLVVTLGGDITFNDELNVSGGTTISMYSTVKNLSLDKISDLSLDYKETKLDEVRLGVEVTGLSLKGTLFVENSETDKGYRGTLDLNVGDSLFVLEAAGGYFDHTDGDDRWSYGFFFASGSSKIGIPMGPIKLDGLEGGLYFNCAYNASDKSKPKPSKGAIGIIFGVDLSTADGHTLTGKFDMAVCVLKNSKGTHYLSTFNMNGDLLCLDGAIDTKVRIVYENNDQEKYFQLNCTVDATADGALKKYADELKEAMGPLQQLTGKAKEELDGAQDVLDDAMGKAFGDKSTKKTDMNATEAYKKQTEKDSEKSDDDVKATAGAHVSLDLRIQSRKDGKNCSPVLWHVYLGEPDEGKRCTFTLVDFKSKIVTVNVGASAYLCIGSELPNNGQLPDLPEKVARFLDGGQKGAVQSDDISKANSERQATINEVLANAKVNGGVMIGASAWGYIGVDLGLFFGEMGATAGFDASIVHYGNTVACVNLNNGRPGYKGWYGSGQLYAYLYAKFGFNINLGFFKKKLTLADAGVGGVLKAQLPNPNYFEGKARCKIKLLNGLVNINKSFQFTCGEGCDFFLGNALDDYQLFEDCNIGTDKPEGMKDNKISWQLDSRPYIATQAIINQRVRVLDPTEENRIKNSSAGEGIEDFSAWASRTFRFRLADDSKPKLIEYESYNDCKDGRNGQSTDISYSINGGRLDLDLVQLNANRYYRLVVEGESQELRQGRWMHPETWDSIKGKYVETPWRQQKIYYFATDNSRRTFTNVDELEKFTKVAYPMAMESVDEGRVILKTKKYVSAPTVDIKRPMISLSQASKADFTSNNKGTLVWMVCPSGYESYQDGSAGVTNYLQSPNDYFYSRQPNLWIENDSVSILTPAADFPVTSKFTKGVIKLLYEWTERVSDLGEWVLLRSYNVNSKASEAVVRAEALNSMKRIYGINRLNEKQYRLEVARVDEFSATDQKTRQWSYRVNIYHFEKGYHTVTFSKELYSVPVEVGDWGSDRVDEYIDYYGANPKNSYWASYVATRLNNITFTDGSGLSMPAYSDRELIGDADTATAFKKNSKGVTVVTRDAVSYLSYLSNLFLIGGYHIKSGSNYLNFEVTTSEGLRVSTPFTKDFVQGGELKNKTYSYQVYNGYSPLKQNLLMGSWICRQANTVYPLCDAGDARLGTVSYASGVQKTAEGYKEQINSLYLACEILSNKMRNLLDNGYSWNVKSWRDWLSTHKSPAYISETTGDETKGTEYSLEVPYYQLAVMARARVGNDEINNIVHTKSNDSYKHWRINSKDNNNLRLKLLWGAYSKTAEAKKKGFRQVVNNGNFDATNALERIKSINYTRYRVNAWNFKKLGFTVYNGSETKTTNDFFLKSGAISSPFKSSRKLPNVSTSRTRR